MDIMPTSVAAVICQALSPALSQEAYGTTVFAPPGIYRIEGPLGFQGSTPRLASPAPATPRAFMQRLIFPRQAFQQHFPFVTREVTQQVVRARMFRTDDMMSGLMLRGQRLSTATTAA